MTTPSTASEGRIGDPAASHWARPSPSCASTDSYATPCPPRNSLAAAQDAQAGRQKRTTRHAAILCGPGAAQSSPWAFVNAGSPSNSWSFSTCAQPMPLARHALKQVDELVLRQPSRRSSRTNRQRHWSTHVGHRSGRRVHARATARDHLQPHPAPVGCRLGKMAELLGGSVPLDEHVGADDAALRDVDEIGRGRDLGHPDRLVLAHRVRRTAPCRGSR